MNVVAMLVALCHRCWTWMEPKHERCVECGDSLDLNQPDPNFIELQELFGGELVLLGEVSLRRPQLPSAGVLMVYEHGFLFLPDLRELPSGGFVALEHEAGSSGGIAHNVLRKLFTRRTQPASTMESTAPRTLLTTQAAIPQFLNSPGAMFITRKSIRRLLQRDAVIRLERNPGKTITWRIESPPLQVHNGLHQLLQYAEWKPLLQSDNGH